MISQKIDKLKSNHNIYLPVLSDFTCYQDSVFWSLEPRIRMLLSFFLFS